MLRKIPGTIIPQVLDIDWEFLYNCLVKKDTTQESQPVVDIIDIFQWY